VRLARREATRAREKGEREGRKERKPERRVDHFDADGPVVTYNTGRTAPEWFRYME